MRASAAFAGPGDEARGMSDVPGTLRLGGEPVSALRTAEIGIQATVPNAAWSTGRIAASAVDFWIALVVDESSGEDGAPSPEVQTLPVSRMLGRVPLLGELPGLVVDDAEGAWDAWYGNDAPPLVDNRLTFGRWTGACIAARWDARVDESWREGWPEGPEPGRLQFEGSLRFKQFTAHAADPANADAWMRATWGEAVIASCARTEGPWCDPVPVFGQRWKAIWYKPSAAFAPA